MSLRRTAIIRVCIFLIVLYVLTALAELSAVILTFSGTLPMSDALLLFVQLPYLHFIYGDLTLSLVLFAVNILLISVYIILVVDQISLRRDRHVAYGLSSTLFAIISIGCVACGSLLSPLTVVAGLGLPLSVFGNLGIVFGILATVLLTMGIVALYNSSRMRI